MPKVEFANAFCYMQAGLTVIKMHSYGELGEYRDYGCKLSILSLLETHSMHMAKRRLNVERKLMV